MLLNKSFEMHTIDEKVELERYKAEVLLKARAQNETKWIKQVFDISEGLVAAIPFKTEA
jgi:hypothetical protein